CSASSTLGRSIPSRSVWKRHDEGRPATIVISPIMITPGWKRTRAGVVGPWGSPLRAPAVQRSRGEKNQALHYQLVVTLDVEEVHAVVQDADEEGAREGPPDGAPAAEEA